MREYMSVPGLRQGPDCHHLCVLQIRKAGDQTKEAADELASQGRDAGKDADKQLKQAGDTAAQQVGLLQNLTCLAAAIGAAA